MKDCIINEFIKYSKYLESKLSVDSKIKFRYKSIINTIKILKKNMNLLDNLDELVKVPGIGKGTIDKIKEIKEKGYLESIKEFTPKRDPTEDLQKVIGIGKIKANKLFKEFNIKTLEDLIKAEKEGKVKLTDANKIGIKYYEDLQERIPRDEATQLFNIVREKCLQIDSNLIIEICGSYRRQLLNSGDIDILISHQDNIDSSKMLRKIIKELHRINFLIDDLNKRITTKYNGVCKLNSNTLARRIDIRYINKESLPFAMLYFTGSDNFNKNMRTIAKQKGYTLNEYQITSNKTSEKITSQFNSEEDIFNYLEIEYLLPKNRK